MFRSLRKFCQKQHGFTVIELVIGVAIIGLIGVAAATGITQVFRGSTLSNNRMTAINNMSNVGYWISQDGRMAKNITITANCPTMTWKDYSGVSYIATYSLSGKNLSRSYQVGSATSVMTVAQNITTITTAYSGGRLTVTVTATVGSASETRTFVVGPRNLSQ